LAHSGGSLRRSDMSEVEGKPDSRWRWLGVAVVERLGEVAADECAVPAAIAKRVGVVRIDSNCVGVIVDGAVEVALSLVRVTSCNHSLQISICLPLC